MMIRSAVVTSLVCGVALASIAAGAQPTRPSFTLETAWISVAGKIHTLHVGVCCTDHWFGCWEYMTVQGRQMRRPKIRFTVSSVADPVAIRAAFDDVLDRATRTCMAPA